MRRRRKRNPGGGGRTRHPNSLANLKRGNNDAPVGNGHALTHGYRSAALVKDVEREVRELMEVLADSAPVRDPDGSLPAADTVAVEAAARALKRWRSVSGWLDLHGRLDERGEVREAARYELQGEAALHRCLDVLGMNPASRSKLGLNLARAQSFDLARHWAEDGDG